MIRIDDPSDPRIAPFQNIRERDLIGHGSRFIAEGEVVLRVLLSQFRFEVEALLIAEKRVEALSGLLAQVAEGIPIYIAGPTVMDEIVGFHIHRGILAVGRRIAAAGAEELLSALPARALVVGLVGIANHDNVGGIFRNAAAFGADAVLLDATSCDPLYRKAIRVSVGGGLVVPYARVRNGGDMLSVLAAAGFETIALSPTGGKCLHEARRPDRVALLLGAEGPGLPDEIMSRCRTISIPMAEGFDSLNVATTSGIALHHFSRVGGV